MVVPRASGVRPGAPCKSWRIATVRDEGFGPEARWRDEFCHRYWCLDCARWLVNGWLDHLYEVVDCAWHLSVLTVRSEDWRAIRDRIRGAGGQSLRLGLSNEASAVVAALPSIRGYEFFYNGKLTELLRRSGKPPVLVFGRSVTFPDVEQLLHGLADSGAIERRDWSKGWQPRKPPPCEKRIAKGKGEPMTLAEKSYNLALGSGKPDVEALIRARIAAVEARICVQCGGSILTLNEVAIAMSGELSHPTCLAASEPWNHTLNGDPDPEVQQIIDQRLADMGYLRTGECMRLPERPAEALSCEMPLDSSAEAHSPTGRPCTLDEEVR